MRTDDSLEDLDKQIERAEQRLVARHDRLRVQASGLGAEVRQTLRPARVLAPALTGAGSLLSLWWIWRKRRPSSATLALAGPRGRGHQPVRVQGSGGLPWLQVVGMAWPVLARLWRKRSGLGRAAQVLSLAGPAAGTSVARGEDAQAVVVTLTQLDPARWAGRWLELASTPPRQASRTPAAADVHYLLGQDGGYDVVRRSIDAITGRQRTTRSVAHPVPGGGGARMRISGWPTWLRGLAVAWDDHWVLHVDDDYGAALVGSRSGANLSLLSREERLPEERLHALMRLARERGYAVDGLRFTAAGGGGA